MGPVETSLVLIEAMHKRWVMLLETVREIDFNRNVRHAGKRHDVTGRCALNVRMARAASYSAHHGAAEARGLVGGRTTKVGRSEFASVMHLRNNSCSPRECLTRQMESIEWQIARRDFTQFLRQRKEI